MKIGLNRWIPVFAGLLLASRSLASSFSTEEIQMGPQGFWDFQRRDEVMQALHRDFLRVPLNWREKSGALGLNLNWEKNPQSPWFIEYQHLGGDFVAAGLALNRDEAVEWGLKILAWGFGKMSSDGSFNHPDRYHSASFFVESAARALLLLKADSAGKKWARDVERWQPKLIQAAQWMARPDVHADNWPDPALIETKWGERRYGHRRYLDAAALGQTWVLSGDPRLLEISLEILRDGLAFQRADGVSPERGGHDSSYQAVGLMYACRYYQMVANEAVRVKMVPVLDQGFTWLLSRIRSDGSVDDTGNTRTGVGGEKGRRGGVKTVDIRATATSLAHWAWLTKNHQIRDVAESVYVSGEKKTP